MFVEVNDACDAELAMDGVGDDGAEGVRGVPNGRFRVTKCSWLQTIRMNSSRSEMSEVASAKVCTFWFTWKFAVCRATNQITT